MLFLIQIQYTPVQIIHSLIKLHAFPEATLLLVRFYWWFIIHIMLLGWVVGRFIVILMIILLIKYLYKHAEKRVSNLSLDAFR